MFVGNARAYRAKCSRGGLNDNQIEAQLADRANMELRIDFAAAFESPPPHSLEMILPRDFEELTICEICQRLSNITATAKSRLRQARLLVRDYLVDSEHLSPQ